MTPTIASLWRHPIKSHGREALNVTTLEAGKCLHGDRRWAVAHEASKADGSQWVSCANFSRGAKAPQLMALTSQWNEAAGTVTLIHPEQGSITFDPDGDTGAFLDWVAPLMPTDRAASAKVIRVPERGMTDSAFPSIALCNSASHRVISQRLNRPGLSIHRWRGNIWLDDIPPWEEAEWIGREIKIGDAVLAVREQITRCLATTANPDTGARDADTLGVLRDLGHQEFGVYAEVINGGEIRTGDKVELL